MEMNEFGKKDSINTLVKRSDSALLKENVEAIDVFNLLDGESLESLRDPSTPEYGYWLINAANIRSLLEYLEYNKTISKTNVVKKYFDIENFNNVFEISEDSIKIFKTYGDSLIRIVITKFKNKERLADLDIYDDVSGSLQVILESLKGRDRIPCFEDAWEYYDKDTKDMVERVGINLEHIENLRLHDLDVKTIDTIIKTIRKEPDEKISYRSIFLKNITLNHEYTLMQAMAYYVYRAMEEHFQFKKVKTK